MTAILWFRRDLRLDDHEALCEGLRAHGGRVALCYCFDEREFATIPSIGFPKTGARRATFLLESVADLRQQARALGAPFFVRHGKPEEILPALARTLGAEEILFHEEVTDEEMRVEQAMRAACGRAGIEATGFWGATLHHVGDLPFYLEDMPDVFTPFRKELEKRSSVRPARDAPSEREAFVADFLPEDFEEGRLPTLSELGCEHAQTVSDPRGVLPFEGGERAARARLHRYFFEEDRLRHYKQTRNGLIGAGYSSKFSPWLALGCLSPRRIFEEVRRYEQERVKNDSTYWLIFELIWRDFFYFLAMKEGNALFWLSGFAGQAHERAQGRWRHERELFDRWVEGRTGVPFVDANMRELARTGFMSNRGRQNVASYLAKELQIDWRWGASYFESALLDYDPCSNWGNWQYVAGVGHDPRDRKFNVIGQGERYDPEGTYIKRWIPELGALPPEIVHTPWRHDPRELQRRFGFFQGEDYPAPISSRMTDNVQGRLF